MLEMLLGGRLERLVRCGVCLPAPVHVINFALIDRRAVIRL